MENNSKVQENSEDQIQSSEPADAEQVAADKRVSSNEDIADTVKPEIQHPPSLEKTMLPPAPKSSMLPPAPKRVTAATSEKEVGYTKPEWSGCPPADQFPYFFEVIVKLKLFLSDVVLTSW